VADDRAGGGRCGLAPGDLLRGRTFLVFLSSLPSLRLAVNHKPTSVTQGEPCVLVARTVPLVSGAEAEFLRLSHEYFTESADDPGAFRCADPIAEL
jgi:hypothetical protein